ncbi:sulfite exporter TauE/SafE family protein [Dysgonomonas sp. 216]|uniref:sulfite exporter TauE/SafE family protein n=1 Tax=Dysgonomonas sp. 216 TaxID=2302934 RepID=UPI0013D030E7|nr:sulfite exporter TauE/SafE family protein [Dysgonomonas sp. 216]NDW18349.1 sulfite exporter TauE/SafE family protein [Dysgonomonas sp. 216]NDW18717.1 sulfite exporter TauE/SafE family protein [Dysgonomonas sp. 216]
MDLYVYIFLIAFIATVFRSTFGFGEALIAVPLLSLFLSIEIAVPLTVLMSIIVALTIVIQDRKQIYFSSVKWLVFFAALGIPFGLLILFYGNEFYVKIALGILIILYSLYTLFGKNTFYLKTDNKFWLFICGFLSGAFGGAYGINGPPLVVYGNMRRWDAQYFRATLQAYFLPANLLGLLGYIYKGMVTALVVEYFLYSLIVIFPAIFLGRYFNKKLKGRSFYKYVYSALILIGLILIVSTVVKSIL